MKLYHSDIFICTKLRARAEQTIFRKLVWSRHAQLELIRDPYGMVPAEKIPHTFNARDWTLIELEVVEGKLTKYVFRRPVDAWRSLVIVLRPACCGNATVVTTWTNRTADTHDTLDRSKYATA